MALSNSKFDASGVVHRASGKLSGTYTAATVTSSTANATIASGVMTINLGFAPKRFLIINATDRVRQEWFDGLAAGNFLETAANGTVTLETDGVSANISVSGSVVTVTFSGGICTDNDTVVWSAEG